MLRLKYFQNINKTCGGLCTTIALLFFITFVSTAVFSSDEKAITLKPTPNALLKLNVISISDQLRCVRVLWFSDITMPSMKPMFSADYDIDTLADSDCAGLWPKDSTSNGRFYLINGGYEQPFQVIQKWTLGGDSFMATVHWPNTANLTKRGYLRTESVVEKREYNVIRLGDDE